jgi:two-component system NarL family sensor kinase
MPNQSLLMQNQELKVTIFFLFTILFLILIIAIIALLVYSFKKNQALYIENEKNLISEHQTQLIRSRLEIHESTLTEISREIHDNINLSLTLAKLQLNTIPWTNKELSEQMIQSSAELIGKSINDLSNLSRSLNADLIASQGLVNALQDEVNRIKETAKINIHLNVLGDSRFLEAANELIIFRIIQEAFQNIIKHANARNVNCVLHYYQTELVIQINDDGVGLPERKVDRKTLGLENMHARAKFLQGSIVINGENDKGVNITLRIPLLK